MGPIWKNYAFWCPKCTHKNVCYTNTCKPAKEILFDLQFSISSVLPQAYEV